MKKCKKCKSEMVETERKLKPALINLFIEMLILIIVLICVPTPNTIVTIIIWCIGIKIMIDLIALLVGGIVRYECPKCGYSKQRVSLFRTLIGSLVEIIIDIFS